MTMLVLAAHPDDETLMAGGTIAQARERGERVHVAVFCSAQRADATDPGYAATKAAELRAAMEVLDAGFECFGFPDQGLDTVPLLELARAVERTLAVVAPDLVITQFSGDVNQDHRRVAEATLVACRPVPGTPIRVEAGYVPSSSEWGGAPFLATVYRALEPRHVDKKLDAMRRYASELRRAPHPRSEEGIRTALSYFGSCVSVAHAEPFVLLREIRG